MKRRPIIAIVCDVIHPYSHGGRELRYQELLPRLAERAEVHVYTMHWWDGPSVFTEHGVTYHAISKRLPLYVRKRRSLKQAALFGIASLRLLSQTFDVLEADHIPYFQVFVLRLVATLKRKPFTVTWHETWSRQYWCDYLGWLGWLAWSIEALAMRLPDHIIAASSETADRLRVTLRRRVPITTVPNGINLDFIRSVDSDRSETRDLVVVGRLMDHKRVDMLLDAVALLHARGMNTTCRIIGDGPERPMLEERAQTLGIAQVIDFCGEIEEQKEVYALVKSAKAFVALSAREGFGIAVLEAIACGIPVLTTSAPDNLAQVLVARYSRGVVCEPVLRTVAAAIEKVLAEANDRPDENQDTDAWVADYDWSAMESRLEAVYFG